MREIVILIFVLFYSAASWSQESFPSPTIRSHALEALAAQMERLDGEALYVRENRATDWREIVEDLQQEAELAPSWFSFMRSLLRLNLAFPNLHSSMRPGKEAMKHIPKRILPSIEFSAEWYSEHQIRYVVSRVGTENRRADELLPRIGDEVVAINGRKTADWQKENFEFCKFSIKEQCDFELPLTFAKELLSWTRDEPLTYTLKRNEATWSVSVEIKEVGTYFPPPQRAYSCKQELNRYADFTLVYGGNRACIYESNKFPGKAIFRIGSFNYPDETLVKNEPIDSLQKEIEALYPWWLQHATWSHLIFDIIDNHGGNSPIGYYQILFQHDFQEQYVSFKKTPEMEILHLRESIFWGSPGQEIWFQNILNSGIWATIPQYQYTNPIPMFCADESKDCRVGLFPVRKHPFRGRISVLLNQWCVSSCDGFAYTDQAIC